MTIDVGTGDGRAILAAAAREPTTLAIGLDADAASMAESSRRAERRPGRPRRGGLENALFVVAAAESPPVELKGLAAGVTVTFPWGSLLRGCLGTDPAVAAGISALVAPAGTLALLLAPAERDGLRAIPTRVDEVIGAARSAFESAGLVFVVGRPASAEEIRASRSTWARRLLASPSRTADEDDRRAVLVRFRCPASRGPSRG